MVAGVTESVIDGAAAMVTASAAVFSVTPVPVARTVMLCVPSASVGVAVNVSVLEVAVAPNEAGANAAVSPAGTPVAVSVTAPVKPPPRAMFTVTVPLWPCTTLTALAARFNVMVGVSSGPVLPLSLHAPATITARPANHLRLVLPHAADSTAPGTAPLRSMSSRIVWGWPRDSGGTVSQKNLAGRLAIAARPRQAKFITAR
jgi:hypothetical protein